MKLREISKTVKEHLSRVGLPHGNFDTFLLGLRELGEVVLVGGAIRDWYLKLPPRDIDLVVDCDAASLNEYLKTYGSVQNRFGGHKLWVAALELDVWPLNQTWAIKHENLEPTFENWIKTPFFNIDCVAYFLDSGKIIENGFVDAFKTKTLDIVYEANPIPALCIVKIMLHKRKYGLELSDKINDYLERWITNTTNPITLDKLNRMFQWLFQKDLSKEFLDTLPAHLYEKLAT